MSKNRFIKVVTDLNKFQDRVDELLAEKDVMAQLEKVRAVISDLKNVLQQERDYVCICAPQIGVNLRLFVVKTADTSNAKGRYKTFINPMIVSSEGIHLSREANLSIPGKNFIIPRFNKVHVAYQDDMGHICSETYIGAYGEVIQQMIQMLDGITLADYGLEIDEDFDNASDKDKREILRMYMESLNMQSDEINKEVEESEELKNLNDVIKMQTGILTGNIVPLDENGNPVDLTKPKDQK